MDEDIEITAEDLNDCLARKKTITVVDIRTLPERAEGSLPEDVYLPLEGASPERLKDDLEKIRKGEGELVLYCDSGARSGMAARLLQAMGLKGVKSLAGGIGNWKNRGYAIKQELDSGS